MNLPDSLACEQALGLGVGGERKEGFLPPPSPPPPRSLLADALLMIKLGRYWLSFFVLHFCGLRRSRSQ